MKEARNIVDFRWNEKTNLESLHLRGKIDVLWMFLYSGDYHVYPHLDGDLGPGLDFLFVKNVRILRF